MARLQPPPGLALRRVPSLPDETAPCRCTDKLSLCRDALASAEAGWQGRAPAVASLPDYCGKPRKFHGARSVGHESACERGRVGPRHALPGALVREARLMNTSKNNRSKPRLDSQGPWSCSDRHKLSPWLCSQRHPPAVEDAASPATLRDWRGPKGQARDAQSWTPFSKPSIAPSHPAPGTEETGVLRGEKPTTGPLRHLGCPPARRLLLAGAQGCFLFKLL